MIKKLSQTLIHHGKVIDYYQDEVEITEYQQKTIFDYIQHNGGACVLAEVNDNQFLFVNQFRYGVKENCLELIAGKIENDEAPLMTVKRELLEETGYCGYDWQYLGKYYPSPAYLSEIIHCYYCKAKYQQQPKLDKTEYLETKIKTKTEILNLLANNQIHDLKTMGILYRYFYNKKSD